MLHCKTYLLFLLFNITTTAIFGQQSIEAIPDCEFQSYYCDTSINPQTTCPTIKRLRLLHSEFNFESPLLPDRTHYEYVFVSLGSDASRFISMNSSKIDTLFYAGVTKERNIELQNAHLHCLILEMERFKFKRIRPTLKTQADVTIQKMVLFGLKVNLKTTKELLKINELNEIALRKRYITKSAIKLLKENEINVLILPEGLTFYP